MFGSCYVGYERGSCTSALKRNSVTSYSWTKLGGSIGRHATAGALFIIASVLHGTRSIFTVLAKGSNSHFPFHPAAAFMLSEILALVLSLVGTMVLGRGTADLKSFKLSTFMLYSIPRCSARRLRYGL